MSAEPTVEQARRAAVLLAAKDDYDFTVRTVRALDPDDAVKAISVWADIRGTVMGVGLPFVRFGGGGPQLVWSKGGMRASSGTAIIFNLRRESWARTEMSGSSTTSLSLELAVDELTSMYEVKP